MASAVRHDATLSKRSLRRRVGSAPTAPSRDLHMPDSDRARWRGHGHCLPKERHARRDAPDRLSASAMRALSQSSHCRMLG